MSATSNEPYRAPSADQLAAWQRELDDAPEPTAEELAELMTEGMAEALEQQEQDDHDRQPVPVPVPPKGPKGPGM